MFNQLFHSKRSLNRATTQAKQPITRKGSKLSPQTLNPQLIHQRLVTFEQRKYPFPNKPTPNTSIYKTTVSINNLLGDNIKKLTNIVHPNIIGVKKILRSSIKCSPGKVSINNFSLIYEVVPYQLRYVGCGVETLQQLSRKVAGVDFRQILCNVSKFLNRHQVYHTIKLADIGVTQEGTLKIYIPPEVMVRPSEVPKDKLSLHKNNQKLINWCQTTFSNSQISQNLEDEENEKPHMSQVKCKKCQSESQSQIQSESPLQLVKKPSLGSSKDLSTNKMQLNALQSSCKSFQSQLSQLKAFQKQKMQRFDLQVQNIKDRFYLCTDKQKRQDSPNIYNERNRQNSRLKKKPSIFESERLIKKESNQDLKFNQKNGKRYRESVQQNINCINIYNHASNKNIEYNPKQSHRLSNNPVLSYKIIPLKDSVPLTAEATPVTSPCFNEKLQLFGYRGEYFDNPFQNIQNQESFDTYDLELNNKDEKEELQQPKYRQTLNNLERNVEGNHAFSHKNTKRQEQAKTNQKANYVSGSHFATESAGPLQFQKFINTYIKPQFLAKKSNIQEDSMEEDSLPSNHQHKPEIQKKPMTLEIPKNKTSKAKEQKIIPDIRPRTQNESNMHRIQSDKRLTMMTLPQESHYKQTTFFKGKQGKFNYSRVQQLVKKSQNALHVLRKTRGGGNSYTRAKMSP